MSTTRYQLPIGDTIKTAWSKVHGTKGAVWTAILIVFVIAIGLAIIQAVLEAMAPIPVIGSIGGVINIILGIVNYLLSFGLLYIGIQRAKDMPISWQQVFRAFNGNLWLKIIGLYILQVLIFIIPALIIAGGIMYGFMNSQDPKTFTPDLVSVLLLLIGTIVMFYLSIRIGFSSGFVLDKESGPIEAIKLSFKATKSNVWNIIFIAIIQFVILAISAIPFGIGLIWTIPFALINFGVMYHRLSANI